MVSEDGRIVGYFALSWMAKPKGWLCLAPVAVQPEMQGRGIGKFAVHSLADEARQRGFHTVTVIWETGDDGPGDFFRHIGFVETGETEYGEKIGALTI